MAGERSPGDERAHDVLAAEAFALPTPDPELRRPTALPEDPSGTAEPHDILAAEEFAMPAVAAGAKRSMRGRAADSPRRSAIAAAVALVALIGLRRRRH